MRVKNKPDFKNGELAIFKSKTELVKLVNSKPPDINNNTVTLSLLYLRDGSKLSMHDDIGEI